MTTELELREFFAKRIIEIRTELNWGQTDLANRMGVRPAFVCDYEKQRQSATLGTIAKFANALGVQAASLLDVGNRGRKRELADSR